jgi:hypothetical protein
MAFRTPLDIANRALGHLGQTRISATLGFTENSGKAAAMAFLYDMLRRPELRANLWKFSTRRTVLRPIDDTTMIIAPAMWSSVTTYRPGAIVSDEGNTLWISNYPDNLNNAPGASYFWEVYVGPLTVQPYDSDIAYFAGELVYTYPGDGTYKVFLSLENANEADPAVATEYDATATYMKDQVVTSGAVQYSSLLDLNMGNTPASSPLAWTASSAPVNAKGWLELTPIALTDFFITYPIGTGPSSQTNTRNFYRLPAGYLRVAPQDPKAGALTDLGSSTGLQYSDWLFEGDYIISRDNSPIVLRFVADIQDVTAMDDMFCEGLAARMGLEGCEEITQSTSKKQACASEYEKFMGMARRANSIEIGAIEPPEDEYLSVRA